MDKQTGKLIARIAENLPNINADLMQEWIDDPVGLKKALFWALIKRSIWTTIRAGVGHWTASGFRDALASRERKIWGPADQMLEQLKITNATGTDVDLFVVSGVELGCKGRNVTHREVYDRAQEIGLALCRPEVCLCLLLQADDNILVMGTWCLVGMEPIQYENDHIGIFMIDREHRGVQSQNPARLGLGALCDNNFRMMPVEYQWIFVLPRPSASA